MYQDTYFKLKIGGGETKRNTKTQIYLGLAWTERYEIIYLRLVPFDILEKPSLGQESDKVSGLQIQS